MANRPVLLLSALLLGPTAASAKDVTSWAKPGVSFADYRFDAVECARKGYFRDITDDAPAQRFLRGFRTADNGGDINPDVWRDSILRTRPDRQKRALQAIQTGDVEACLMARGYTPFTLTPDQRDSLDRLRPGSPERHQYLHTLATR